MINVSRSGQHHDYLPQTHTTHIFNGRHGTVGNDQLTKGYKKFMGKGNIMWKLLLNFYGQGKYYQEIIT